MLPTPQKRLQLDLLASAAVCLSVPSVVRVQDRVDQDESKRISNTELERELPRRSEPGPLHRGCIRPQRTDVAHHLGAPGVAVVPRYRKANLGIGDRDTPLPHFDIHPQFLSSESLKIRGSHGLTDDH